MRTLALLSIWLALPLLAEEPKPDPTLPTHEESDALMMALVLAQGAEINLLKHFAAKQAGFDDAARADAMAEAYEKLRAQLAVKYHACDGGQLNFQSKTWMCPPAAK